MSSLESISPSRSSIREDSNSLAVMTLLTETGKLDYKDTSGLLAMASMSVRCSLFLPSTESDSYRESERVRKRQKKREREREKKLQRESA